MATIDRTRALAYKLYGSREQIAETPGWPARFQVLDRYLSARLIHGPTLARPVQGATRPAAGPAADSSWVPSRAGERLETPWVFYPVFLSSSPSFPFRPQAAGGGRWSARRTRWKRSPKRDLPMSSYVSIAKTLFHFIGEFVTRIQTSSLSGNPRRAQPLNWRGTIRIVVLNVERAELWPHAGQKNAAPTELYRQPQDSQVNC